MLQDMVLVKSPCVRSLKSLPSRSCAVLVILGYNPSEAISKPHAFSFKTNNLSGSSIHARELDAANVLTEQQTKAVQQHG